MIIGILKEPGYETRVSLLAEAVVSLTKKGITVQVEAEAGGRAFCSNEDYEKAGAQIKTRNEVLTASDIVLSIQAIERSDLDFLKAGILIGVYQPLHNPALMRDWAIKGITTFSLDMLPRTTRAQTMDVLSSQANIAGYKAVLMAANIYPRYFPMFMTAAGTIPPAKVLILGAGVAGLHDPGDGARGAGEAASAGVSDARSNVDAVTTPRTPSASSAVHRR